MSNTTYTCNTGSFWDNSTPSTSTSAAKHLFVTSAGRLFNDSVSPSGVRLSKRAAAELRNVRRIEKVARVVPLVNWAKVMCEPHNVDSMVVLGHTKSNGQRNWVQFVADFEVVAINNNKPAKDWPPRMFELVGDSILSYRDVVEGVTQAGENTTTSLTEKVLKIVKDLIGMIMPFRVNVDVRADFNEMFKNITGGFNVQAMFDAMLNSFNGVMADFKDIAKEILKLVPCFACFYGLYLVCYYYPQAWNYVAPLAAVLFGWFFPEHIVRYLKKTFPRMMGVQVEAETQASFLRPVCLIASVMGSVFEWKPDFWEEKVLPAIQQAKQYKRTSNDLEANIIEGWGMVSEFTSDLCGLLGIRIPGTIIDQATRFVEDVVQFKDCVLTRKVQINNETASEYHALMKRGNALLRSTASMKNQREIVLRAISLLQGVAHAIGPAFVQKISAVPEPVCFGFHGPPGIGKSEMLKNIHTRMACKYIDKETLKLYGYDLTKECYVPDSGDYDEGYAGQFTWLEDDFGQEQVAPNAKNSSYMRLIRYINPVPCSMNMAFDSKGLVYFNSRMVLLSSNNTDGFMKQALKVLTKPEALERRTMNFWVEIRPEFSEINDAGQVVLSPDLCNKWHEENGLEKTPDFWVFSRRNFLDPQTPKGYANIKYTFEQVIDMVSAKLQKSDKNHEDYCDRMVSLTRKLCNVEDDDKPKSWFNLDMPKVTPLKTWFGFPQSGVSYFSELLQDPERTPDETHYVWDTLMRLCRPTICEPITQYLYTPRKFENHKPGCIATIGQLAYAGNLLIADAFKHSRDWSKVIMKQFPWLCFGAIAATTAGLLAFIAPWVAGKLSKLFSTTMNNTIVRARGKCQEVLQAKDFILNKFKSTDFYKVLKKTGDDFIETFKVKPEAFERIAEEIRGEAQAGLGWSDVGIVAQNISDIVDKIKKNAIQITGVDDSGTEFNIGVGWMLTEYVIAYPYHFDLDMKNAKGLVSIRGYRIFSNNGKPRLVGESTLDLFLSRRNVYSKGQEIVVRDVPWSGFKNILSHFKGQKDLSDLTDGPAIQTSVHTWNYSVKEGTSTIIHNVFARQGEVRLDAGTPNSRIIKSALRYNSILTPGTCGSMVFQTNGHGASIVLGLHIAGSAYEGPTGQLGWCNVLSREFLTDATSKVSPQKCVVTSPTADSIFASTQSGAPLEDPSFDGVGILKPSVGTSFVQKETKKVPTEFLNQQVFGPPTRMPAVLDPSRAMKNALSKYTGVVKCLPLDELRLAAEDVFKEFMIKSEDIRICAKTRTNEEAVTGIVGGVRYLKPVKRSSSAGFPFCLSTPKGNNKHRTKKFLLGEDDWDFSTPQCVELFAEVDQVLEDALLGKRSLTIFIDFLKDELRPLDRVAQGKTRMISGGPLVYTIACRRLFMDFMHAFEIVRQPNHDFPSIVGINPYNEYDALIKKFKSKGTAYMAGDFSSYDGSEVPDIHHLIVDVICKWYSNDVDFNVVRRVLLMEMTNSYHLGGLRQTRDLVYQWVKGLPSGHPLTCLINTMYNMIVFRWTFRKLCPGLEFDQHVCAAYYGDDNLHSMSDDVKEHFNQLTVVAPLATLGLTYTDDSKSEATVPWKAMEEISILKRQFRFEEVLGKFVAPLNLTSILEMIYWHKPASYAHTTWPAREAIFQEFDCFLRELSLHGFEVWSEFGPKALQFAKKEYNIDIDSMLEGYDLWLEYLRKAFATDYAESF